jgi:hypothetical protein
VGLDGLWKGLALSSRSWSMRQSFDRSRSHRSGRRDCFRRALLTRAGRTRRGYKAAVPVLLRHLAVEHRPKIRCAIIRALITEDAKTEAVWNALQTVFLEDTDQSENGVKWTAAWALANLAAPDKLAILRRWADDPDHAVASKIFHDRLKGTRFQVKRRLT